MYFNLEDSDFGNLVKKAIGSIFEMDTNLNYHVNKASDLALLLFYLYTLQTNF